VNYDLSFVVTPITVTCYSWAPSSSDHYLYVAWSVCDPVVFAHIQCGIDPPTSGRMEIMTSSMSTPHQTHRPK